MSVPECFWIMGNKCHPDGSIVPDEYKKNGTLYIRKQAYEALQAEAEALATNIEGEIRILDAAGAKGSAMGLRIALKNFRGEK